MKPSFPEDRVDFTNWINHNTLMDDLRSPLHEVQRGWIRKPVSIFLLFVLFFPALFLAFLIAICEFFNALGMYLRAAVDTYKGQKAV